MRVDITIKNATRIPLLGIKNEPSPYIIMECQETSYATPIAKYSQNPIWNYHTLVQAKKATSYIHFYIYNNNPNAVDELLAYCKVECGELMTRTNTQSKLKLVNSLEEPINSYLFLEHYDVKPPDLYLPLGERTSIMLRFINSLPADQYFTCEYGDSSFNLSEQISSNAFRYNPKYDRIRCVLQTVSEPALETELLIGNIGSNNCMTLRFYGLRQEYVVFLATSIMVNGLLPENYNILNAKITDVTKSNGKKNSNYRVKIYGPLNQSFFNQKAECQLYVENNSQVLVEYFEQTQQNGEGYEPYCSFRVPMNSLNWSNETFECAHQLKYYDNFKNIETAINFKFSIKKSFELSKIIPKLNNTEISFDADSTLLLEQIKLQNCYLFEVIKNNVVQLFHVDMKGIITSFNKFTVTDNRTQYSIATRESLPDGGLGTLYLINLDQQFTDKQTKTIENSLIFKITIEQPSKIQESKIEYSNKFLAYAKKASVVNICKKFNQMVHDDLLKLKLKSRLTGNSRRGILKILNVKAIGSFGKVSVQIAVDSVLKSSLGQTGNYLLDKSYSFYINEGNIKVKVRLEGVGSNTLNQDQNKEKKEDNYSICYYGSFCDFFGTPSNNKVYSQELKISLTHKLQIFYSFQDGQKLIEVPIKKGNDIKFLESKDSVSLNLKRAFLSVNNKDHKFRISRGGYIYESQTYRSANNKVCFENSETLTFRMENGENINPIFISAYSYDEEDKLLIYNGFINATDIFGKGEYEVILAYQKQEKRKQIFFIFQVTHSASFLSEQTGSGIIKLNKISPNTSAQLFRNIYKHYLLIKINNYQYDIYECAISEQSLTLNATINIRRSDVLVLELYSSYKAISKELFNSTEKEMIACGNLIWEEVEQNGTIVLNYYPKKQSQLKFTKNFLSIQEKCYKLHLCYKSQKAKIQARIQGLKLKPNFTEIDVLNRGVLNLFLKDYYPIQIQSKLISVQIKSLNLQISSQSSYKINKSYSIRAENMQFQLEASMTLKEGDKYKRVSSTSTVKLRGNHFKINQATSLIINFEKYFYLTANFTIFHNKFVSIPFGDFIIREISTRGVKIDRFDLAFQQQLSNEGKQSDKILKKEGTQAKSCDILLKTTNEMNYLILCFEGKGFKAKSLIYLSQLNIDRYDEEFVYQKQILVGGQGLILTLKVSYSCIKQVKQQQLSMKYRLDNSQEITVNYNPDLFNTLTAVKQKSQTPNKSQGFFIQIFIPNELTNTTKQIQVVTEAQDPIILLPTVSKNNQFIFYSNKYLEAKNIKLISKDFIDRSVEPLGKQQNLWKFMVDQNPKLICTLSQSSCSISSIGNQNWTFKFNFHRLLALNKKRLLCLKNAPNDQILTKNLAILVKHGSQYQFVREIDELGNKKDDQNLTVQFGYDSSCNILEVFLIIDNFFNKKQCEDYEKMISNWIEFFPICYGSINVSNILPDLPLGFELLPLKNNSLNLEKAINKMIVREQNIFCLCDFSFMKKNWGFITIKLKGCTSLFFPKNQGEAFIYFKIQIQDNNRISLFSFSTEARPVGKIESIDFTNNSINKLFIQENIDCHYNLKITGFVLENSNHYSFVEKRQDITDYLQRRGKQQINIQIKANETNNLCKNTFQINVELWNSIKPLQRQNLIEKAKSINSVDALSFRQLDNIEFFQRLLGCQQLSHFNECLEQIKESFIYVENPQYSSFILLIQYLSFNFDSKLIAQILEIIHLNVLKCPQIISDLEQSEITKSLYDYFKLICQRERKKVPSKVIKVSNQEYLASLAKFKEKKDIATLKETLELQMYVLYNPDQLLASLSAKNNEAVLNIINLFLKHSKIIKESLSSQIGQWIEMFGFTPQNNEFELFVLVLKNSILYGTQLTQKSLQRFCDILLQRTYGLSMVFEFWQQLNDKNQQITIYESILQNYEKQFERNSVETCRGLKMMLNHILTPKSNQIHERLQKVHQSTIKLIISNISKSTDIILLSSHFDLLSFLLDHKLLIQGMKPEIGALVKSKTEALKDNSSKMILSSYTAKFSKGKVMKIVNNTNKKEGLAEEMASKVGFYKKYLITSD